MKVQTIISSLSPPPSNTKATMPEVPCTFVPPGEGAQQKKNKVMINRDKEEKKQTR